MGSPEENLIKTTDTESFYSQYSEGLPREIEKAFQQSTSLDYIRAEGSEEMKELLEKIEDCVAEGTSLGSYTRDIMYALREAASEGNWSGDEYNFDLVRGKLEQAGVPLKDKKTSKDYQ